MNRGVEIGIRIADGMGHSLIRAQVKMGSRCTRHRFSATLLWKHRW
jgi:hypothetical protein